MLMREMSMPCLGWIYAFNIFCVAFIGRGCHIRRSQMGHLQGAKVSEKVLKWGICGEWEMPSFAISLTVNDLQKGEKRAYFRPTDDLLGKQGCICALFVNNI